MAVSDLRVPYLAFSIKQTSVVILMVVLELPATLVRSLLTRPNVHCPLVKETGSHGDLFCLALLKDKRHVFRDPE
jgi:hypothetical protein